MTITTNNSDQTASVAPDLVFDPGDAKAVRLFRTLSDNDAGRAEVLDTAGDTLSELGQSLALTLIVDEFIAQERQTEQPPVDDDKSDPEQPSLMDTVGALLDDLADDAEAAASALSDLLLGRFDDGSDADNLAAVGAALAFGSSSLSGVAGLFFTGLGATNVVLLPQLIDSGGARRLGGVSASRLPSGLCAGDRRRAVGVYRYRTG